MTRLPSSSSMSMHRRGVGLAVTVSILLVLCGVVNAIGISCRSPNCSYRSGRKLSFLIVSRGGSRNTVEDVADLDEDEDEDEVVTDDEEDDEEVLKDEELSRSTVKATEKARKAKVAKSKTHVSAVLTKKKKKQSSSPAVFFRLELPYIVKCLFRPAVWMAMTRGYFASLFDVGYLDRLKADNPGGDLRSALEAKARQQPSSSSSSSRRKKTQKRGQPKTLSDLPKLSA